MLSLVFYYVFAASIILFYGVGQNRLISLKKDKVDYFKSSFKALLMTVTTTAIAYLINTFILVPLRITEIFPFFTAFFFVMISFALHSVIKTGPFDIAEDYAVPFMIILISIFESWSILSAILISVCSVFAFYLISALVFSIRRRFRLYQKDKGLEPVSIMILSIAVIFIAFYCTNASWLTMGANS